MVLILQVLLLMYQILIIMLVQYFKEAKRVENEVTVTVPGVHYMYISEEVDAVKGSGANAEFITAKYIRISDNVICALLHQALSSEKIRSVVDFLYENSLKEAKVNLAMKLLKNADIAITTERITKVDETTGATSISVNVEYGDVKLAIDDAIKFDLINDYINLKAELGSPLNDLMLQLLLKMHGLI